ncbi:MAG: hypothetical protein QXX35_04080 [Desulfurococcaceae archaeon]
MTDLVLLTNINVLDKLVKIITSNKKKNYVIVSDSDYMKTISRTHIVRSENVKIVVFKKHFMLEEKVVKLLTDVKPDRIIDCDPLNKLIYIKKYISSLKVDKINCVEFINSE